MKKYITFPIVVAAIVIIPACASTIEHAKDFTCNNRDKVIAAAKATIEAVEKYCPIAKGEN